MALSPLKGLLQSLHKEFNGFHEAWPILKTRGKFSMSGLKCDDYNVESRKIRFLKIVNAIVSYFQEMAAVKNSS